MKTTITIGKLKISIFTLIVLSAMFYGDFSVYTLLVLLCAAFHEAGHLFAMKLTKCNISQILICPFGAEIKTNTNILSYVQESIIYLSGPLFNLLFAVISFVLFLISKSPPLLFLCFSNFALFFVNILPIKNLDGGKTLECILSSKDKNGLLTTEKVCELFSCVGIFVLTLVSLYILHITQYNFSLLIFCAYLIISTYAKNT